MDLGFAMGIWFAELTKPIEVRVLWNTRFYPDDWIH